jgi:hypothetical protein
MALETILKLPPYVWVFLFFAIPIATLIHNTIALHWQQAPTTQIQAMDTVPTMVEDLRPNLHDLDRPKANNRDIRPNHCGRIDGKAQH